MKKLHKAIHHVKVQSKTGFHFTQKLFFKRSRGFYLVLTPLLFFYFFTAFFIINTHIQKDIQEKKLHELSVQIPELVPYPKLEKNIETEITSSISAEGILVLDDDSQVTLYSKNKNTIFSMASTTKIMTALITVNYFKPDDVLTVQSSNVEGVTVGFKKGEKIGFRELLYAMLLPSGNDAAMTIAENYSGGVGSFVDRMNQKAQELHLASTRFFDPTGLSEKNVTTVSDLARLASLVLKNPLIAEIVSTKHITITNVNQSKSYSLTNLNRLLGINGIDGVKTGFTEEAGEVLVTSRKHQGHRLIVVVMKSKNRFLDTSHIVGFASNNISYISLDANSLTRSGF